MLLPAKVALQKKNTSGEQMQVLAVYFARRPMFPQQGEPMAGYKPAPLGMMQIPDGARSGCGSWHIATAVGSVQNKTCPEDRDVFEIQSLLKPKERVWMNCEVVPPRRLHHSWDMCTRSCTDSTAGVVWLPERLPAGRLLANPCAQRAVCWHWNYLCFALTTAPSPSAGELWNDESVMVIA